MPSLIEAHESQLIDANSLSAEALSALDPFEGKVFVDTIPLVGPVEQGFSMGVNKNTGVVYYKDPDGNWAEYKTTLTVNNQAGHSAGAVPLDPPLDPDANDVVIEIYDEHKVWWRYFNGAWVEIAKILITNKQYQLLAAGLETLSHVPVGHLAYIAEKFGWYIKNDIEDDFTEATGWDWVRFDSSFSKVSYLINEHEYLGVDTSVSDMLSVSTETNSSGNVIHFGIKSLLEVNVNGLTVDSSIYDSDASDTLNLIFTGLESEIMGDDKVEITYPVALELAALEI